MILTIVQFIFAALFLYLFWRCLRENYHDYKLVEFSWMIILGFLVGSRLMYGLFWGSEWNGELVNWFSLAKYPGMNLFGGYLGILMVSFLVSRKNNWKIWQLLEDVSIVITPFLLVVNLLLTGDIKREYLWGVSLVLGLTWLAQLLMRGRYRSLPWYPSGKKGFLWFWANIIGFFLLFVLVLALRGNIFYGAGFLILGLISAVGLFMLGRQ